MSPVLASTTSIRPRSCRQKLCSKTLPWQVLDDGETVTLPSVEDANLWANFDAARIKMFQASHP